MTDKENKLGPKAIAFYEAFIAYANSAEICCAACALNDAIKLLEAERPMGEEGEMLQ